MKKYSEVVGIPVICIEGGKKVGIIKDILFYPKEKKVTAFLLERRGCQIGSRVLLLKDVASMGEDAVIVNDTNCIKSIDGLRDQDEFRNQGKVKGLRVYSRTREDFGIIEDVFFDLKTGKIEEVELSDGLLEDLAVGRNILPLFGKVEFGSENLLVDKEAVEEMVNSGGGLKKRLLDE